jgi:2-polyprenyl-3-methyl-5-hydroxy-6-metoxy-1,4-benzoquinol methylase
MLMELSRPLRHEAAALVHRARRRLRPGDGAIAIDHPAEDVILVDQIIGVSGWAFSPRGVTGVDIQINDGPYRAARYGLPRPDVAAEFGDSKANRSGWIARITADELREGSNVIRIRAQIPAILGLRLDRHFRWRRLAEGEVPYEQVDLGGERYDPRYPHANSVAIEHRSRYRLAASLAPGKRVLDAGCGLGYGASTLARAGAVSVDAIDASSAAIGRARHDGDNRVEFAVGDVRSLPYPSEQFDLVACFEVLEHMVEHETLIDELKRVLVPGGVLLVSTPNKDRYLVENPWHLKELTPPEFDALLRSRFAHVRLLGQQLHLASILADSSLIARVDPETDVPARLLKLDGGPPGSEIFDVAVASDATLPELEPLIALGDARDDLVDATITNWRSRAITAEAEVAMLRTRLAVARNLGHFDDSLRHGTAMTSEEADHALREELDHSPFWMYAWDLGELGKVQISETLAEVHQTRLELVEPSVRKALAAAGPHARALDLACSEGYFSHKMLEWGAETVIGIDVREQNVRRATLVRDHFGIDPERLSFHRADVFALPELDQFDVVLMLGLVYHLENPVGAFRIARALTRGLIAVESQLTQQTRPILAGNGEAGRHFPRLGSFATWFEEDQSENPLASYGAILSLIPNEAALLEMASVAGFAECEIVRAGPNHEAQYRTGERAVMIARGG